MTDTLPDVEVVGQRRREPHQPFPERPEPAVQEGQYGELPPDFEGPPDPCADPETALPWNADAAGARSADEFLEKAGEIGFADAPNGQPTLGNREFGRGLARRVDGTVWGNPVTPGPPRDPATGSVSNVTIIFDPITYDEYIGDAHSHPNGNPLPSQADWDGFIFNNNEARRLFGRASETFYMYVITVDAAGRRDRVHVYQDGPRAFGSPDPPRPTEPGDEVNPDAQPCP